MTINTCNAKLKVARAHFVLTSQGTPRSELNSQLVRPAPLGAPAPTPHHTFLFDTRHFKTGIKPAPFPRVYEDKWDAHHVKMPCSPENIYPVEGVSACRMWTLWFAYKSTALCKCRSFGFVARSIWRGRMAQLQTAMSMTSYCSGAARRRYSRAGSWSKTRSCRTSAIQRSSGSVVENSASRVDACALRFVAKQDIVSIVHCDIYSKRFPRRAFLCKLVQKPFDVV